MSNEQPEKIIQSLLKTRCNHIKNILSNAATYIDIIREIIMSINPIEFKRINAALTLLRDAIVHIPATDFIADKTYDIYTVTMDLYSKFALVDSALREILSMFENETYLTLAIHNMSSSYVVNLRRMNSVVTGEYEKYLNASVRDDDIIFDYVFKMPHTKDDLYDFATKNEIIVNKFTVKFVGVAIKEVEGSRKHKLEDMIEKQKDIIFDVDRLIMSNYSGAQASVVRYNLLPATPSMSLTELFALFDLEYKSSMSLAQNWEKLANKGSGIIALTNCTKTPVEFNMDGLINSEYVTTNQLNTPPLSGLTKKIIQRFNTVKRLEGGSHASEYIATYPSHRETWYVMETLNGIHWRQLAYKGETKIPKDVITGLYVGITTRPDQYNLAQSDEILKKCFDAKSQLTLDAYTRKISAQPSSEPIRAKILDQMTRYFEPSAGFIKTTSGVKSAAVDIDRITSIINTVLAYPKSIGRATEHGASESMITYFIKMNDINNTFVKELNRRWTAEIIDERLFKDYSGPELKKHIMTVFTSVTKAAIDELDNSKLWTGYDQTLKEFVIDTRFLIF